MKFMSWPERQNLELPKPLPPSTLPTPFTNVGKQCVGCQINGKTAGLSDPLQSGVTVNIKTVEGTLKSDLAKLCQNHQSRSSVAAT